RRVDGRLGIGHGQSRTLIVAQPAEGARLRIAGPVVRIEVDRSTEVDPADASAAVLAAARVHLAPGDGLGRRHRAAALVDAAEAVVVQHEATGRLRGLTPPARGLACLVAVAGDAAPLEDGPNVAVVFDVLHPTLEAQPGHAVLVPLLAGLVVGFGGHERSVLG